ncbi:MAG: hypothetical protein Q7S29_01995 [Candidatus Peribacter sp.]|nr:hypothetical protein [Candidatus Peribacter sp.]
MFCQYCGGKIDKESAKFCKTCGKPLNETGGKCGSDTHHEKGAGSKENPHMTNDFLKRFWPEMETDKECIGAAKVASVVAAFLAVFFAIISLNAGNNLGLIDVALFGAIAFFIWKMSRIAAVSALILYLFECYTTISSGTEIKPLSWVFTALYIYAFVVGIRGTFAYQKRRK